MYPRLRDAVIEAELDSNGYEILQKFQTRNYMISEMRIFDFKYHLSIGHNNKELKLLLSHINCIGTKMDLILKVLAIILKVTLPNIKCPSLWNIKAIKLKLGGIKATLSTFEVCIIELLRHGYKWHHCVQDTPSWIISLKNNIRKSPK